MQRTHAVRRAVGGNRLSARLVLAAAALVLSFAPRTAAACTCGLPRPQLVSTALDGSFRAALPLLVAMPPGSAFQIEDATGRQIPVQSLVELPRLGQCATPWSLIALDDDPVSPGNYRLVRGPDDADNFALTAGVLATGAADLAVSLWVETVDPFTPVGSLCADPKIAGRPFSRIAHVSLGFSAPAAALPMFATVAVSDPQTPTGLAQSTFVSPFPATRPDIVDLPLEDGTDACATVTIVDGAGVVVFADRLCAVSAPDTRSFAVRAIVPTASSIVHDGWGCSMSPSSSDPIGAALVAMVVVAAGTAARRRT